MNFEQFINNAAINYIEFEFFQDECNAAGIVWNELPNSLEGVKAAQKYLRLRDDGYSHDRAIHELSDDLRILKIGDSSLSDFPRNHAVLREMFDEAFETWQLLDLADKIHKDTAKGAELVREYQTRLANSIEAYEATDFVKIFTLEHKEDAKKDEVVLKIPGFELTSQMIGGFNKGRLTVVTGRTGLGKTNFAINLALRSAPVMNVAYCNMEMTIKDITKRMAVIKNKLPYYEFNKGNYNEEEVISNISIKGLFFTSGKPLKISQIKSWVKLLSRESPIGLLIVDYDQAVELVYGRNEQEWMALKRLMTELDYFTREMNLHCVVLCQENREGEISGSFRSLFPASSHLRLHYHEKHGAIIQSLKHRHGEMNQAVKVNYDRQCSAIDEIELIDISEKDEHAEQPRRVLPSSNKKTNFKPSTIPYKD